MASKFVLIAGDNQFECGAFQSPKGLRNDDKRPDKIIIESNEVLDLIQLRRYINYLNTLANAME